MTFYRRLRGIFSFSEAQRDLKSAGETREDARRRIEQEEEESKALQKDITSYTP